MKFLFLFVSLLLFAGAAGAGDVEWTQIGDLPGIGVLRPYAGVSNGRVLLAGGSNFPDKPLAEGGAKRYHDEVYALDPSLPCPQWSLVGRLGVPSGEGGAVTTSRGIVCVGGVRQGEPTSAAFIMRWERGTVVTEPLPKLPQAVKFPGVAADGGLVYVATSNCVWTLPLTEPRKGWSCAWPLPKSFFQPQAIVCRMPDGSRELLVLDRKDGVMRTLGANGDWRQVALPLRNPGSAAVSVGKNRILFLGGNPFSSAVSCYDFVTGEMVAFGTADGAPKLGQVAIRLPDGRLLHATGEISAGIRTPQCFVGHVSLK